MDFIDYFLKAKYLSKKRGKDGKFIYKYNFENADQKRQERDDLQYMQRYLSLGKHSQLKNEIRRLKEKLPHTGSTEKRIKLKSQIAKKQALYKKEKEKYDKTIEELKNRKAALKNAQLSKKSVKYDIVVPKIKEGASHESIARRMDKFTDENMHTETVMLLAQVVKNQKALNELKEIATEHMRIGHMTQELIQKRMKIREKLENEIKEKFPIEVYKIYEKAG